MTGLPVPSSSWEVTHNDSPRATVRAVSATTWPRRGSLREQILAILADWPRSVAHLAELTGRTPATVANAMTRLRKQGLVVRANGRRWRLA